MPKAPFSQIVPAPGIRLDGGVVDEFLVITSPNPDAAAEGSPRIRRSGNDIIIESTPGRLDTLIGSGSTLGANGQQSVVIGATNTVAPTAGNLTSQIVIGEQNSTTGVATVIILGNGITYSGTDAIIIGNVAVGGFGALTNTTVTIGTNMTLNVSPTLCVAIGDRVSIGGNNSVVIGASASNGGGAAVAVGQSASAGGNSVAVGQLAGAGVGGGTNNIAIGVGATVAAGGNQVLLGARNNVDLLAPGDMVLGNETSGTNQTRRLWLGGPKYVNLGQPTPQYEIRGRQVFNFGGSADINAGYIVFFGQVAQGNAAGGGFAFQTTIPGASGNALQVLAEVFRVDPGTATEPRHVTVVQDKGLWFENQTDGAGAGAGTLTNAPTAGDPTFWLPVRINGADFFIPCWP